MSVPGRHPCAPQHAVQCILLIIGVLMVCCPFDLLIVKRHFGVTLVSMSSLYLSALRAQ